MGDAVRVMLNGQPFENSAGGVLGAVDLNATSPNFPGVAHNLVEIGLRLSYSPGGCYSPPPAYQSASLSRLEHAQPGDPMRSWRVTTSSSRRCSSDHHALTT